MPSIRPNSSRLSCRSRNAFSPAAALWQHFVLPNRPIFKALRQSSTAAEAAESMEIHSISSESSEVPATQVVKESDSPAKAILNRGKNKEPSGSHRSRKIMLGTQKEIKDTGNYDGIVVKPRVPPKGMTPPKHWPWHRIRIEEKYKIGLWEKNRAGAVVTFKQLNHEIHEFHEYMRPTAQEALARQSVIEGMSKHVRMLDKRYKVEVFGSERTALAFATSDIDLRLTYAGNDGNNSAAVPPQYQERKELMRALGKLARRMQQQADYIRVGIRHARYPLLSMQNTHTGLDVQVVLANDTTVSRKLMAKYMEEFPYLHELYSVIKASIDIRGLSDVFRGGFGSYNIFMMIVASLKHSPPEQSDGAHGLLNFLHFWATFDTKSHGVSIEPVLLYDKSKTLVASESTIKKLEESKTSLPDFMLSLRDPADDTNDLGRKGICIKHFQATCKYLYHQLVYSLDMSTGTMLRPLVESIYSLDEKARAKLEAHGKSIAAAKNGLRASDKERLKRLARAITDGKTPTYEIVAPGATESPKEHEQPAVDISDAVYEHGDAIVSSLSMPKVEGMTQAEAQELAEREATQVNTVEGPTRDEVQDFVVETMEVNGQDKAQEQSQDLNTSGPPKVDVPKATQDQAAS